MGNLLTINFGTFAETDRFKTLATQHGFISTDLMENNPPPGELVSTKKGGIQKSKWAPKGTKSYTFTGLEGNTWRGKLKDGRLYRDIFKKWMDQVISQPVHCLYLTGHHWDDHDDQRYMFLSWGDESAVFHLETDTKGQKMSFGTGRGKYLLEVDTTQLRSECYVVFGFGCNVATGINSTHYQAFFNGGRRPFVFGWNSSISVPRHNASENQQVSRRFFSYLKDFAKAQSSVPSEDRFKWFYNNQPMELINAWGFATSFWHRRNSRARHKDGTLYKFKFDEDKGYAVPEKA